MKIYRFFAFAALLIAGLANQSHGVMSDTEPRAMGLAQSYTALARGPQAVFWNPANLALSGSSRVTWQILGAGFSLVAENNSFSMSTYNDNFTDSNKNVSPRGTSYFISEEDKKDLLYDIPGSGLKMNVEVDPILALGLPINGGVAFPMPGGIHSAVTIGLTAGFEGEVPKDMLELLLFGNKFAEDRLADGKAEGYDISEWDGSGWAVGSLNWAGAKPWMPAKFEPYLSEFTVGGTLKFMGGAYGEIMESGGNGLVSRRSEAEVDTYLLIRSAGFSKDSGFSGGVSTGAPILDSLDVDIGGTGFGLDLGVAGVTKDRKTTFSVGLLNFFDAFSWSSDTRQDSLFVTARNLRVTRFIDPERRNIEDILDNEDVDGDGDVDFHKKIGEESFSRSLPAVLRVGVAHEPMERLTVVGNYDQAFSNGFGISTTPRLSSGVEYRLVPWFPMRFGLSLGGRWGSSTAIGFAFGPFELPHMQFSLLDLALVTRGGFFPGIAKGTAISLQLFRLDLTFGDIEGAPGEEVKPHIEIIPDVEETIPAEEAEAEEGVESVKETTPEEGEVEESVEPVEETAPEEEGEVEEGSEPVEETAPEEEGEVEEGGEPESDTESEGDGAR